MSRKKNTEPDLSFIEAQLRHLAVPVETLTLDPRNANQHHDQSIAKIAGSLRQYGQRTPIVVQQRPDGSKLVRKGNGTLQAARLNGWSHIAALVLNESDAIATGYAIADNATGRLSHWDEDQLRSLLDEIQFDDVELIDLQKDLQASLERLKAEEPEPEPPEDKPTDPPAADRYCVLVTLGDEAAQACLLQRLNEEGFQCRAFIA